MRNLKTNVQRRKLNLFSEEKRQFSKFYRSFTFLILFLMSSFVANNLFAQGCLSCEESTMDTPFLIGITQGCSAEIEVSDLESDTSKCTQERLLIITNLNGVKLFEGVNKVMIDSSGLINEVLVATIRSSEDTSVCMTYFKLVDLSPPTIDCNNIRLTCGSDTSAVALGLPTIDDNCEIDPDSISYRDIIVGEGCIGNYSLVFNREWTVRDKSGNVATCTQAISVLRPDIMLVDFPKDIVLDCSDSDISPNVTGYPLLAGDRIDQGSLCNVSVTYLDDTISVCAPVGYHIKRNWVLKDLCTNNVREHLQNIRIVDNVKPEIIGVKDLVIPTDPGACFATVNIPVPQVIDNCDAKPIIIVQTSYGQQGFGPHLFVPKGLHMVHFTAFDRCGNENKFSVRLEIVDGQAPAAIADEYTSVAIPTSGFAKVPAKIFDSGSYDNCRGQIFFKAKKEIAGSCSGINGDDDPNTPGGQEWFDDELLFCCSEVGENVRIIMRVYDVNPGEGPVDPKREEPGGDLVGRFTDAKIFVEVQDNVPPWMTQLEDVTVDCEFDFTNLSQFGSPFVDDYCGFTLDSTVVFDLNECGVGTVRRIFTATDLFNNKAEMVQTIYVKNESPFTEDLIMWPENYTSNNCLGNISPNDLPDPYSEPKFKSISCADLSVSFEDEVYETKTEACYKVIRKWTVIDLCTHDPKVPDSEGKFQHVQIIKIDDNVAPELNIPADTIVALANNCESVTVFLSPATVDDCSDQTIISSNSEFAFSPGGDASGVYPVGTTVVEFTAIDKCGNVAKKSMSITVTDLTAPSIRCRVGLEVPLNDDSGTPMGTVQARDLDFGSIDNCTNPADFQYFVRISDGTPNPTRPTTTEVSFSCDDIGRRAVELWVTDNNENSGFCVTFIQVTDANNVCPNTSSTGNTGGQGPEPIAESGLIAGIVLTEEGNTIEDVMIQIEGDDPLDMMTGSDGIFSFSELPFGKNYVINPEKDKNVMNGVSTLDLVFMAKHILGTKSLESPYQWIAADIDGSGTISTLDLIKLRKLILHLEDELPSGQPSWRFIDANFEFSDDESPLLQNYPSVHSISDFNDKVLHADFIGVKVGDLNVSARVNGYTNTSPRTIDKDLKLFIEDKKVVAGEEFSLTFDGESETDLLAYQFTLDFDPEKMELIDIQMGNLPNMSMDNFGTRYVEDGLITTSWNDFSGLILEEKTELFTVTFRAYEDFEVKESVSLSSRLTPVEAYNQNGEIYNISLEYRSKSGNTAQAVQKGYKLYQNQPNPFVDQTTIGFDLAREGEASLIIYDASGKEIYQNNQYFSSGYNEVKVNRSQLPANGLLYYQLRSKEFTATRKMILIK